MTNDFQSRLVFDGAKPRLDADGNLLLATAAGEIRQRRPRAYQNLGGRRTEVMARYRIDGELRVGIELDRFDARLPLVIDPVLEYGSLLTYNGITTIGSRLKMDSAGNLYIAASVQPNPQGQALQSGGSADARRS